MESDTAREIAEKITDRILRDFVVNRAFDTREEMTKAVERIIVESLAGAKRPQATHSDLADNLIRAFESGAQRGVIEAIVAEGITGLTAELVRLVDILHRVKAHPDYEYETTECGRKQESHAPDGEAWEPNIFGGDPHSSWSRGDYQEWHDWRRIKPLPSPPHTPHRDER